VDDALVCSQQRQEQARQTQACVASIASKSLTDEPGAVLDLDVCCQLA
jgi:hypothetical protein